MLNWERFKSLSGSDNDNFEKLCRSIVRRRFGGLGPLIERKNQPGVEYYISLNKDCVELGEVNDQIGWQCKWFNRNKDGSLTASSKNQILHSLKTTDKHLPDLTRWILWTPFTLVKSDQDWFYGLQSSHSYQMDLWTDDDVENSLNGPALELKWTYFEDLALTSEVLEKQHCESVAPIRERWIKEVHQCVDVEKEIRKFLGEPNAWEEFQNAGELLFNTGKTIQAMLGDSGYFEYSAELKSFSDFCIEFAGYREVFRKHISGKDIDEVKTILDYADESMGENTFNILRKIRKRNLPISIEVTNALAYANDIRKLLRKILSYVSCEFIAVLADAGGGKTQLAAEITASQPDRLAGVLLHGRQLRRGYNLDNLAHRVSFYGQTVQSFSSLVSALDAAACRENCRLPIIIDGLSEAEDAREWKPLLATALEILKDYPNVLLVCTLRTGEKERSNYSFRQNGASNRETFAQLSLPEGCTYLQYDGFGELTRDAVISYFDHYKIEADLTQIPEGFFSHPLNLRIFCEATNRKAEQSVKVDRFPASIATLFDNQIEYAAQRISELPNLDQPYTVQDVWKAIYNLGMQLWDSGNRYVDENEFLNSLGYDSRSWDSSIVNLLSQEGIIFRDPGEEPYSYVITPIYDLLGGYIIADALLKKNISDSEGSWIKNENCIDLLFGDRDSSHQLSQDIVHSLVALMPKVTSKQFWTIVPKAYQAYILRLATLIDSEDFCDETRDAYRNQVLSNEISSSTFLQLKKLRSSRSHPLNADFFSSILKELSITSRDLSWTEYLRSHRDELLREIHFVENQWKSQLTRTEGDRLKAVWVSWVLTSTVIELRDFATRALYWYGRGAVRELFEITIASLEIDDLYVSERLLAVSYGVAMFYFCNQLKLVDLEWIAKRLHELMFSESAGFPTTHILARDYASNIIKLANKISPGEFSDKQLLDINHPFPSMPRMVWETDNEIGQDPMVRIANSPFRMDFENYTIGRLVPERGNYDYDNSSYQEVRAKILWRVKNLGWSYEKFNVVDREVSNDAGYSHRMEQSKIERYGKKYSWIAYHEMAGDLLDEGKLRCLDERFIADIDPNFPIPIEEKPIEAAKFLGTIEIDTNDWVTASPDPNIDSLISTNTIDDFSGDWLLLNGFIIESSKKLNRDFYVEVKAFFLDDSSLKKLIEYYEKYNINDISVPDLQRTGYLYAGELYWSSLCELDWETEFEVAVGTESKSIKQPDIQFNRNEDGSFEILSQGEKIVNVEVPIYEYVNTIAPVAEYSWSTRNNVIPSVSCKILNSKLVDRLQLIFDPSSLQFLDSHGVLAAKNISYRGSSIDNSKSLFYIRKDLLVEFLEQENMNLVWCVKGERRMVRADRSGNDSYANFSFYNIFEYSN